MSVRRAARKAYLQYKRNPRLVSFEQKGRLGKAGPAVYGARIDDFWRALALIEEGAIYWFWIGSHTDYDRMLKGLSK